MAKAKNERQRIVAIPDDGQEGKAGYQPVRPENVVDVPPEDLPSTSGESPIANPPASSGGESNDSGSNS